MKTILRRAALTFVSAAAAAGMLVSPAMAGSAQAAPNQLSAAVGSSQMPQIFVGSSQQDLRNIAWDTRNNLHNAAGALPPQLAQQARQAVDGAVNGMFPGLIDERSGNWAPVPAPAPAPAPNPHHGGYRIDSPCPVQARVCVDLNGNRTWIQHNGYVTYGPAVMSAGAPGPETETPRGMFTVVRKVRDEVSIPFDNAPMPYAVYFTNAGHAFHEGRVDWLSHGCIHLMHQDAVSYFDQLHPGDLIYIY